MRIGIYGNLGHSAMAIRQGHDVEDVVFVGYCPALPGENLKTLEDLFEKHNLSPQRVDTLDQLLALGLDVLVVDNIFGHHVSASVKALEHGLHVFSEKPLATTLTDLEALETLQNTKEKELWGMYTLRYEAPLFTMKHWIDQGAIGEVRMITAQKSYRFGTRPEFYKDHTLYGGTIPWVAIHGMDAIQSLYPKAVQSVFSLQSSKGNHNHGTMEMSTATTFQMEKEVIAVVHADFFRPENAPTHGDDRVRVAGTQGVIECKEGEVRLISPENHGTTPLELLAPPLLFQDFIQCVRTGKGELLDTKTSFAISRLALLARKSAEEKKVIIL